MVNTMSVITAVVVAVILVASLWAILCKAGEKGWKAIIPVYNMYTEFKLFWKKSVFWIVLILVVAISGLTAYSTINMRKGLESSAEAVAQELGYSNYSELLNGLSDGSVTIDQIETAAEEVGLIEVESFANGVKKGSFNFGQLTGFSTMTDALLLGLSGILSIVLLVFEIIFYNKMSKAFGHGAGFTLGLILLQPLFMLILAFGGSKYQKEA